MGCVRNRISEPEQGLAIPDGLYTDAYREAPMSDQSTVAHPAHQPPVTALVPLSKGKFAVVDAADFEWLSRFKWSAQRSRRTFGDVWYARRRARGGRKMYMHRLIMDAPDGVHVDHKDGDGLNNTRSNLRFATRTQQCYNTRPRPKRAAKHSRFKGISWHTSNKNGRTSGRWRAEIILPGGRRIIRYARTEDAAKELYDAMIREHHGEFARFQSDADRPDSP